MKLFRIQSRMTSLLLLAATACGGSDSYGSRVVPATAGAGSTTTAPGLTGSTSLGQPSSTAPRSPLTGGLVSVGEATREQYCAGSGPPISLARGSAGTVSITAATCTQALASALFQSGLCTCDDASFTGAFAIDAIDSTQGSAMPATAAASVGIDGRIASTGVLQIHGSLIAAGGGLTPITSGDYLIDGNFETRGDLITTGANITFGRDLWVDGDIRTVGMASVKGDVHQTPGHASTGMSVSGQMITENFVIPAPCACQSDQLLDIDAIVAAGAANSHNRDLGLGDGTVVQVRAGNAPLDLDCGRFAFGPSFLVGDTQIVAHGRTALFIDGDLAITGRFGVDLGTDGELDVFVSGNLLLTGAGDVGENERPGALRFYVGGSGDIAITGATRFAANLYAPRSNVFVTGVDDIYGAFFVGSYHATGAQRMHYDTAVLRNDGGPSCKQGCTADLDCTSPLVCRSGRCTDLSLTPF